MKDNANNVHQSRKEAAEIEVLRISNKSSSLAMLGKNKRKNNRNNPLWRRYSHRDLKNAKKWRDMFAHANIKYENDGTTHFHSLERRTVETFSLRALRKIGREVDRLCLLIPMQIEIQSHAICEVCGARASSSFVIDDVQKDAFSSFMPLPCGHTHFKFIDEITPTDRMESL